MASEEIYSLLNNKTKENINTIVSLNKGIVGYQLKKFSLTFDEEAISYGFEALYRAIIDYNPAINKCFSTVATVYVRNSLLQLLRERKVYNERYKSVSLQAVAFKIGSYEVTYEDRLGSNESIEKNVVGVLSSKYLQDKVEEVLDNMAPGHKNIITLWHNSNYTLSNRQLAEKLNVKQPYINRVINIFRKRFTEKLKEVNYERYS